MIELVEEAQAFTIDIFGPMNPYLMERCPAARSGMIRGMRKGLKRGVPSPAQYSIMALAYESIPPTPVAQITPILDLSSFSKSRPLSITASSDATNAYCEYGSSL